MAANLLKLNPDKTKVLLLENKTPNPNFQAFPQSTFLETKKSILEILFEKLV